MLLYPEGEIRWTTGDGDGGVNGLGGSPAEIGLDSDVLSTSVRVPGSGTDAIATVEERSNFGVPGAFFFRVDGGIIQPQSKLLDGLQED